MKDGSRNCVSATLVHGYLHLFYHHLAIATSLLILIYFSGFLVDDDSVAMYFLLGWALKHDF